MHRFGKWKNVASVLKYHGKMWCNFAVPHFAVPNFAPATPPPPPVIPQLGGGGLGHNRPKTPQPRQTHSCEGRAQVNTAVHTCTSRYAYAAVSGSSFRFSYTHIQPNGVSCMYKLSIGPSAAPSLSRVLSRAREGQDTKPQKHYCTMVGGWRRLAVSGSWRLVVLGLSRTKKLGVLKDSPGLSVFGENL